MLKKLLIIVLCLCFLASCTVNNFSENESYSTTTKAIKSIMKKTDNLDDYSKQFVDEDFLFWVAFEYDIQVLIDLQKSLEKDNFNKDFWYEKTGTSVYVLKDIYLDVLNEKGKNYRPDIKQIKTTSKNTVLRFVGDVSFADNWKIMPKIIEEGKGIEGVLSTDVLSLTKGADVFLANNEFTYSNRGTPLNKTYTFRAKTGNLKYMLDMGADVISLANNHAYDYGPEAFEDTLSILNSVKLPYIGAGANFEEASKPRYFIINGRKYAFSAATRAEKNKKTPEATDTSSGVMRVYDPEKYLEVVKKAEKECDYNIVYLHWGLEDSHKTEKGLYELASQLIDAGADAVIGSHAHVLQGIDYYKDVPIIYNLGNFIFNHKTIDTGIFEIEISDKGVPTYKFIPAIQKNCYTSLANEKDKARILKFLSSLSPNVNIDENGIITKK